MENDYFLAFLIFFLDFSEPLSFSTRHLIMKVQFWLHLLLFARLWVILKLMLKQQIKCSIAPNKILVSMDTVIQACS